MKKLVLLIVFLHLAVIGCFAAYGAVQGVSPGGMVEADHWAVSMITKMSEWGRGGKAHLLNSFKERIDDGRPVSRSTLAALLVDFLTSGGYRSPRRMLPDMSDETLLETSSLLVFLERDLGKLGLDVPDIIGKVERELKERSLTAARVASGTPGVDLSGVKAIPDAPAVSESNLPRLVDMTVTPTFINLSAGGTFTFKALGRTAMGRELVIKPRWGTAGGIGTIDETGRFTAEKHGNGMVTAHVRDHNDFTSYAIVRVEPRAPVRIEILPGRATLVPGESLEFMAAGYDEAGLRVPIEAEWSLDGAAGKLEGAVFTARGPGAARIMAQTPDRTLQASAVVIILSEAEREKENSRAVVLYGPDDESETAETGLTALDTSSAEAATANGAGVTGALLDREVALDFVDMELADVLQMLFMETGTRLNLSVPADVQASMRGKKLSGHYRETRFGDILEFLTKNNGYQYVIRDNTVLIKQFDRSEMVREVVALKYADAGYVEEVLSSMRLREVTVSVDSRLNAIVLQTPYAGLDKLDEVRHTVTQLDIPENQEITEIFQIRYADIQKLVQVITPFKSTRKGQIVADDVGRTIFVSDVGANVRRMKELIDRFDVKRISTRIIKLKHTNFEDTQKIKQAIEQGAFGDARSIKLTANEKSNSLIVTAPDEALGKIGEFINLMDQEAKQVMIEAKIVEVTLDSDDQFGIDWDLLLPKRGSRKSADEENKIEMSLPVGSSTGSFKFGTIAIDQFELFLDVLNSSHRVKLLSSPSLMAMNNQKAFLNQGDTQPVPKYTYNDQVGKYEVSGYEEKNSGIQLDVTPTIYDDYIILDVHPKVTNFTGSSKTRFGDEIPTTNTRETQTRVKIYDGETLIISGMIQEKMETSSQKIPILGELPFLKSIFTNNKTSKQKTDTMVFLTPRVVKPHKTTLARDNALKSVKKIR